MKKFLSLFIAVLMVASIVALMPVFTVSAAEPTYDGDSFDPTDVIANKQIVEINKDVLTAPVLSNGDDNFGETSYGKFFDGDYKSKIEGNLNGSATITFETKEAAIVTDYLIYTGNDNEDWNGRNPKSWVLQGTKDGATWVTLDEVLSTGLDEVNSTPYAYKIDSPDVYKNYRIIFSKNGGYCQVNELVLYTATGSVVPEDSFVTFYKDILSADASVTLANHGLTVGATVTILGTQANATVTSVNGDTVELAVTGLPANISNLAFCWTVDDSTTVVTVPVDQFANTSTAIGFIQLRPNASDALNAFDVRVIVEAYETYVTHFDSAVLDVTVTYGDNETRTFTFETTKVYESIKAGNETFTPSDGCLYFGGVITGVPNGDYNVKASLTLTVDGEETEIVLSENGNDVTNPFTDPVHNTQEATNRNFNLYAIEEHTLNDVKDVYVVYSGYDDVDAVMQAGGKIVLNINGKNYFITEFNNFGTYWGRLNAEAAGVEFLIGAKYDITMYVFDANYKMVYYTNKTTAVSPATSSNATDNRPGSNVELPAGTTVIEMDKSSASSAGLNNWGDGPASNLIDGNATGSKIGGDCSTGGTITVTFKTTAAASATYYTLYTGGDTANNPGRNPISWKLYGKVGNNWVVLSEVGYTNTTVPGIEATNSTPYTWAIANVQNCQEYKIEFIALSGKFQMNELVLHTGN